MSERSPRPGEVPIEPIRGTRAWMPSEAERLGALEMRLMNYFRLSGYRPIRTPILEPIDLHERKSGAGIVSKLVEVSGPIGRACLRPELTAGIVRAYVEAPEPPLPWRVALSAPVFRLEELRPGFDREFHQVGVEMLGASGPAADAELIWLADGALTAMGLDGTTIRIGHVGLILEILRNSGLPEAVRGALIERLSDAASEGREDDALDEAIARLVGWTEDGRSEDPPPRPADGEADGIDRLFRDLVPVVVGRRSGSEILGRLRRKWDLGHSLADRLEEVRARVRDLASLRGKPAEILDRLGREQGEHAPESVAALRELIAALVALGVSADRIEIDLGFGRGIGFYSQLVFSILAAGPDGPIEVCGGGRYDGLARVLGSDRDDRGAGFAIGLERLGAVLGRSFLDTDVPLMMNSGRRWLLAAVPPKQDLSAVVALDQAIQKTGGGWDTKIFEAGRPIEVALAYAGSLGIDYILEIRGRNRDGSPDFTLHCPARGYRKAIPLSAFEDFVTELTSGGRNDLP